MHGILESLRKCPFTLLIIAITIIGFIGFKPSDIAVFPTPLLPVKLLSASFLHLNLNHLVMNLVFWGIAGSYLELRSGSKRLIIIFILATLIGGVFETLFIDEKFIGLSAACYGVLGALIYEHTHEENRKSPILRALIFLIAFAAVDIALNLFIYSHQVAVFAHTGGLVAGFLSSLGFGKNKSDALNRTFRPMEDSDVAPILAIIYDHDEDDGEEAKAAFAKSLANKYVMTQEGRVMGMTGYRADPYVPQTAWLSFTYIHEAFRKRGNAYWMMLELRNTLERAGVRQLFIATSDYLDEETGEDIYLPARNFYEHKLNARRELRIENFYAPDESKYIYSLPVAISEETDPERPSRPTQNTVRFVGLEDTPESDTSYIVLWEEMTPDSTEPPSNRDTKTFPQMIAELESYRGKALFLSLPDYLSDNHSQELKSAGFRELGILHDYYGVGTNEVHWGQYFA